MSIKKKEYTKSFSRLNLKDIKKVGGKNAALGEMFCNLKRLKIPVPDGFAVTTEAYWAFVDANKLRPLIQKTLKGLDVNNSDELAKCGKYIRDAFLEGNMPDDVTKSILNAYRELGKRIGIQSHSMGADVAVRSSATAEDLPTASFAGQQESFLHVQGNDLLLEKVRNCFASLFTDRAIVYRVNNKFNHLKVALSAGVQHMVRSDVGSAGVMFTLHTESGFRDVVLINSSWGLGESVVKGAVNPDQFLVHKPLLSKGYPAIIEHRMGNKVKKVVYGIDARSKSGITKTVSVENKDKEKWSLQDQDILQLAKWGIEIEKYFSKLHKNPTPMDIEWARDGKTKQLYIVQARLETVASQKTKNLIQIYSLKTSIKPILTGVAVGQKIGVGSVRKLSSAKQMHKFKPGDVLVARMTDPDWVAVMKQASAIVTEQGGRTCHAAIVSRELGIPCVVGVANALTKTRDGEFITVSAADGEVGHVYRGKLEYSIKQVKLIKPKKLPCKVMMNIGNPDLAFSYSALPVDGVGLARMEFVFTESVKIHPMAAIKTQKLDTRTKQQITKLIAGYPNAKQYVINTLAEGMAKIAAAFYPKTVIVRLSDFKTNEYANLIGGKIFEPHEANPMLGWRGASRYYDPNYAPGFMLECAAVRHARETLGLDNIIIMIPFCRTVEEAKKVLKTMKQNGLSRGRKGLKIYMMVEIPSNIILADQFADLFDGFSIGSNDLTQLTLGVDRDSALVSKIYDERNQAVKDLLSQVIKTARNKKIPIGICGQAPSDYPEIANFLIKQKIDSISLTPDTVMDTIKRLSHAKPK
ncbi:phosphoenolpyruvate synthase [Patescibacteria group bacterium]|nr:phosphoenolpyruvate synthase [Patescibacteria group bacterium]